jgi:hypothetical protein
MRQSLAASRTFAERSRGGVQCAQMMPADGRRLKHVPTSVLLLPLTGRSRAAKDAGTAAAKIGLAREASKVAERKKVRMVNVLCRLVVWRGVAVDLKGRSVE